MVIDAGKQELTSIRDNGGPKELGHGIRADFAFEPGWRNLNHGSYGTVPHAIQARRHHYMNMYEAKPDHFIRVRLPELLDESRAAVAELVNAPVSEVVFVNNATEGVNTVLRNLEWNSDGKDTIVHFSTVYDACARAEDFVSDYSGRVGVREIQLDYPLEDGEIITLFRDEVRRLQEEDHRRARVALFDVVSSNPGVRFPWVQMVAACRELGVTSLVDGAHGVGMVPLDLSAADPDFFVSNCHKWLHTPRGCALFYVPLRNQHLLPSTLATARGYAPRRDNGGRRTQPLLIPHDGKSHFERNFEWVGTRDDSPYLSVRDAIAWRKHVLGGEDRIMAYMTDLSRRGIRVVADALGTDYLDNKAGTMTDCAMANVALPIWVGEKGRVRAGPGDIVVSEEDAPVAFHWINDTMFDEFHTFMAVSVRWDRFWVRLSAQVYLELEDYEWAGGVLKELCRRVGEGEFKKID
ncbi:hercynylcysteine S-oxide lyase [Geosmithia morbida]|uniref:Hercynylcysteine S-oxide lyase n=1 Tax=Geosmithia morbida TaxID=1094350 RepID=A0A9P5D770_9HYPO|nr:hercynylcysteine S-oxide lyase [Geosmithia morbida]KAF4125495.1 hercynylcysteine S-oxide lyase [Geosmithia morbida]